MHTLKAETDVKQKMRKMCDISKSQIDEALLTQPYCPYVFVWKNMENSLKIYVIGIRLAMSFSYSDHCSLFNV